MRSFDSSLDMLENLAVSISPFFASNKSETSGGYYPSEQASESTELLEAYKNKIKIQKRKVSAKVMKG